MPSRRLPPSRAGGRRGRHRHVQVGVGRQIAAGRAAARGRALAAAAAVGVGLVQELEALVQIVLQEREIGKLNLLLTAGMAILGKYLMTA